MAEVATRAPSKEVKGKAVAKPKKVVSGGSESHPPCAKMILEAVTKLEDKSGSSLQAIKKYIAEVHKADVDKLNPHIKRAVKKLVEDAKLVQTSGQGAAGSFKMAPEKKVVKEKKPAVKKTPAAKMEKAAAIKPKKTTQVATKAKATKKEAAKPAVAEKGKKPAAAPKAKQEPKKKAAVKQAVPAKGQKKATPKKK